MPWIRRLAKLVTIGMVCLALLGLVLWVEHKKATSLPEPTGPNAVGRVSYEWVNAAESDPLAPTAGAKREVVAWIWYPAKATASSERAEYLPAAWRAALSKYIGPVIGLLTRDMAKVHAHSFADAEVLGAQQAYPVVLMRAGLGALTTDYTTLAEDLASHGYVVVGFDAPYRTLTVVFSDGRVVTRRAEDNPETLSSAAAEKLAERLLVLWCDDAKFMTDQLERLNAGEGDRKFRGRLDLEKLGMFGHSFGGAQAAEFCHEDARCKAAIDIDGRPFGKVSEEGLQRPFLFLMSDHHGEEKDAESQRIIEQIEAIYNRLPAKEGALVTIRGTNHFSFSDQILLKNQMVIGTARFFGVGGNTDGRRGLQIAAAYVSAFFDRYLKGAPEGEWKKLQMRYPEATVEMR
jgi:dienelactone hydrolase